MNVFSLNENSQHGERKIMRHTYDNYVGRWYPSTNSMTLKKRVFLSLTSPKAVLQSLALEPLASETSNV